MGSIATAKWIGLKGSKVEDVLLLACLVIYTVGFLAIHKATNVCLFLALFLAIVHFARSRDAYRALNYSRDCVWLMCAFAAPFVAVAATKLLRWELSYRDLDSESRYLIGAFLLSYFMLKQVNLSRILEVTLPLALIATLIAALLALGNPRWAGRYATSFVDPNVLGSYAAILTFMTLMTLDSATAMSKAVRALKFAGIAAGLWLTLLAASRGGWLAIGPMFLLWAFFRFRSSGKKVIGSALLIIALIASGILLVPGLKDRIAAPASDVTSWADGSNKVTASGQRLSIWKLSLHLIAEKPLTGWGIPGAREMIASPNAAQWIDDKLLEPSGEYGGAHNDALQMVIQSGIWGLVAYVLILFVPLGLFLRRRARAEGDARLACELGACLVLGVMVCGLTNEMLSLKYLASFFSITVAGLAAQALSQQASISSSNAD